MNIYILNTLSVGIDITDLLLKKVPIKGVIGLSERTATDLISGYTYLKNHCEINQLEFIEVQKYDLSSPADQKRLLSLQIDLLLIVGWQRLIPQWLIQHCRIGVIGVHGSAYGMTKGRGRSPQNWALILGKTEFRISIFHVNKDIDSGNIVDEQKMELTLFDDIKTSYYKTNWLIAKMLLVFIQNGCVLEKAVLQSEAPEYLPQRLPEDGHIDWNRSSMEIYNFVRALTRPYPGAFTFHNNSKLTLWKVRPMQDVFSGINGKSGELLKIYPQGELLVKSTDNAVLVENYSIHPESYQLKEGMILTSASYLDQLRTIIRRHQSKYPDFPVCKELCDLTALNDFSS